MARDVDDAMLERRTPAGTWVAVKRLSPAADGTFAVKLRATVTTVYRLSADGLGGPPLTVRVARVRRRALLGALAVCAALLLPAHGLAARDDGRAHPGARPASVAGAIERATGERATTLAPLHALAVDARPAEVRGVPGVAWVEPNRVRRVSFVPTDPLAAKQWYAIANRAYDAWETPPPLAPVRVAVIDSGIDLGHPDLARQVAIAKSFVGGTAQDTRGHGTIVAGSSPPSSTTTSASRDSPRARNWWWRRSWPPTGRSRCRPSPVRSTGRSTTARGS